MALLPRNLWSEEEAQGLSEYALLFVLIALTAVTAMGGLASRVDNVYSNASAHVIAATNSPSLASGSLSYAPQTPGETQDKLKNNKEKNSRD